MPLQETLPLTPATAQWPVWSTTARIVVTDAERLEAARAIATRRLAVGRRRVQPLSGRLGVDDAPGRPAVPVSEQLADLVRAALEARRPRTGWWIPPSEPCSPVPATTVTGRDEPAIDRRSDDPGAAAPELAADAPRRAAADVPAGVRLDLGATGKAFTADLIAAQIAAQLSVGVLVALGGDIATAGPEPAVAGTSSSRTARATRLSPSARPAERHRHQQHAGPALDGRRPADASHCRPAQLLARPRSSGVPPPSPRPPARRPMPSAPRR